MSVWDKPKTEMHTIETRLWVMEIYPNNDTFNLYPKDKKGEKGAPVFKHLKLHSLARSFDRIMPDPGDV